MAKANGTKVDTYVRSTELNAEGKPKALRADVGTLIPVALYQRRYASGSTGFSGTMVDTTGRKYKVDAVLVHSKDAQAKGKGKGK